MTAEWTCRSWAAAAHTSTNNHFILFSRIRSAMVVTRIVANLSAPDPTALAKFYAKDFELDLPFDMGWIAFLNKETTQKIELHTASEGGSGTQLPVIRSRWKTSK